MTDMTLHPTPRWRDVVLEQIRVVGMSLRREALVAAVVLAIGTLVIGSELVRGGPGFDSRQTFPTAVVAFLFPFAVWRNEKRFGPAFLWTLPVDRRGLSLAKVFAGLIWLMVLVAGFIAWLLSLGLLAQASFAWTINRIPFVATIAAYLLGSAIILGLRHPLRWLLGTAAVCFLIGILSEAFGSGPNNFDAMLSSVGFTSAAYGAAGNWTSLPALARWAIPNFLFLGIGLVALWAAASRHAERRRH